MPKRARELSALEIGRLSAPGLFAVGGVPGLYLQINGAAKSWILRALIGRKRRDMGLGGYPAVTLAMAREKARQARAAIDAGTDPILERDRAKSALLAAQASAITFAVAARMFMDGRSDEWRSDKHRQQWANTLDTYAGPIIGSMHVADVRKEHVLAILEPIWKTKTATATRVRGRIEQVLDWATARGHREGENPARWRGHLDKLLSRPNKIAKVEHHAALPIDAVGAFMADLRMREGVGARALELLVLTAARSGEVRGAAWSEIDLEGATWTIPASRMKAHQEHRVPLSKPAVRLLKALPRLDGCDLVFPGSRGKPLSDMTLTAILRRMDLDAVPHGFRSTFRDWCSERTSYPAEVAEMALAHAIGNKVEAAYRRGDLLAKRAHMMEAWADFCSDPSITSGAVVRLRARDVA
ncbi:tyrosine-type recombinase/integrase [Methylibium sp.]|uniref:tyrosine-type recombinase/integrase n=1 Tax=Methylibium sp. TaxID=2067992 RepID=UPI003D0A4AC8